MPDCRFQSSLEQGSISPRASTVVTTGGQAYIRVIDPENMYTQKYVLELDQDVGAFTAVRFLVPSIRRIPSCQSAWINVDKDFCRAKMSSHSRGNYHC